MTLGYVTCMTDSSDFDSRTFPRHILPDVQVQKKYIREGRLPLFLLGFISISVYLSTLETDHLSNSTLLPKHLRTLISSTNTETYHQEAPNFLSINYYHVIVNSICISPLTHIYHNMSAPIKFLELSTDVSEPFIIPNVSPLSPQLQAANAPLSPITDATIARDRGMSIVELK